MGWRLRGVTVGAVIAIMVLSAVSVMGVYQIMRAYAAGFRALSEYSVQVQKPTFRGESVQMHNSTHVLLTLVNEGPVGARVSRVHVFLYDPTTGVPSSTDEFNVSRYVPVGGRLELYVHVSSMLRYAAEGRPVRLAVETDKGPVLTSMPALRGTLRINVLLPTYGAELVEPLFIVTCPPQRDTPYFKYMIQVPNLVPRGFTFFQESGVLSVSGDVPALAACLVEFSATVRQARIVKRNWTIADAWAQFYVGKRGVAYMALADVKPGGVAVVDISIPELLTEHNEIQPPERLGAQVIDFSWYFFGLMTTTPAMTALPSDGTWANTDYAVSPHPYKLTHALLQSGVIEAVSPHGCVVYPPESPAPPGLLPAWDWYEYTPTESEPHAYHTGPTIVVPNPLNLANCPRPLTRGSVLLRVSVPFELTGGRRYVVVPVFTYDDRDEDNRFRVTLRVTVTDPDNAVRGEYVVHEPPRNNKPSGPIQVAAPIVVSAGSTGFWKFNVYVVYEEGGDVEWLRLILSKVVIIPVADSPVVCAFDAPVEPAYPFADVRIGSGAVLRNAPLILRIEARTKNTDNPDEAQQIMRNLIFWYEGTSKAIQIHGRRDGRCTVVVENTDVSNVVRSPSYCAMGTSVTINFIAQGEGYAALIPYKDTAADPYGLDLADRTLLYATGYEYADSQFTHFADFEKPMLGIRYKHDVLSQSQPQLQVLVTAPSHGQWLVAIPFAVHAPQYPPPPVVVSARPGHTDGGYAVWEIVYEYQGSGMTRGAVFVSFTGQQVAINMYFPVEQEYRVRYVYVHSVVLAPQFTGHTIATPLYANRVNIVSAGIRVFNVTPATPSEPVHFRLVRKGDGRVIGAWRYSPGRRTVDVLLTVDGIMSSMLYGIHTRWTNYFVERPPLNDYVLVVQNVRC